MSRAEKTPSPAEQRLLLALRHAPALGCELAGRFGDHPLPPRGTLYTTLRRLVAYGWATIAPGHTDRRARRYGITTKGLAALKRGRAFYSGLA
jgi:DNA-binding PadR family transcriptional regulator